MIGQSISHYKILEKLGEGGMGVVYKAQDTKLDRLVALKFLPDHVSSSTAELERFIQEAKAAAGLNHPNICTIHGIEEAGGKNFIVMEFVDGQTLQEKKPTLSVKQAIDVGIQIAEGLAAAHEKGIVHRDIKPENIMIRKDGRVQIMDFGLAKLRGASRLTKEGSTVGTAGYMSPEQVQGQDTDQRSDIFSLGVLLYEMLSGQAPFKGIHETAIAYEIVNVDSPPMSSIRPEIPPDLDAIVLECLEKDPKERTQSASQIAVDLKRYKRESSKQRASRIPAARPRQFGTSGSFQEIQEAKGPFSFKRLVLWQVSAGVLLVFAISVSIMLLVHPGPKRPQVVRFTVDPPEKVSGLLRHAFLHGEPVVSPDGHIVAFSAQQGEGTSLFLRHLDQFETIQVQGGGRRPFFSPDGQWLGFFRDETVWKMSTKGEEATRVGEIRETIWNINGQGWLPDGRILVLGSAGIWELPSSGGEARLMARPDSSRGELFSGLSVSQEGLILVSFFRSPTLTRGVKGGLMLMSSDGHTRLDLPGSIGPPASIVGNILVFTQSGQLRATYLDPETAALVGEPVSITGLPRGYGANEEPEWFSMFPASMGRSATWMNQEQWQVEPVWVSRSGVIVPTGLSPDSYRWPRLSPDGGRMAVKYADQRLYVVDLRTKSRVLLGDIDHTEPVWSTDGRSVVFSGAGMGSALQVSGLLRQVSDASRPPDTLLAAVLQETWPTSYSPDGNFVAFYGSSPDDRNDLFVLDIRTRKVRRFPTPGIQRGGRFSPNGRWLAYQSDESGKMEVYVRPWPEMSVKYPVSAGGGEEPVWSHGNNELYFRRNNAIMVVRVSQGSGFQVSPPAELFRGPFPRDRWGDQSYDVTPDGRFLMLRFVEDTKLKAFVVLNWIEEIRHALERGNK